MIRSRTRAALLAGAATLSLSAASFASEFSNVIVFGDRFVDAGQYVDFRVVFPEDPDAEITTDGRGRFTNYDADGNIGRTWATRVSRALGKGDTNPSQPQRLPNSPPVETGLNFGAGFFSTFDILQSVDGNPIIDGIDYRDDDAGITISVPGTTRKGLLNDDKTAGWAANSIVLMNGGSVDVRRLANVVRELDGTIDLAQSYLLEDKRIRDFVLRGSAGNISTGAIKLRDADASLVVVSNLMDMGAIPESSGDIALAQQGIVELDAALAARQVRDPLAVFNFDERQQRAEFERIVANPTLISDIRTDSTNVFNAQLAANLDGQDGIILLDQNAVVAEIIADPARFGLSAEVQQDVDCLNDNVLYPCNEVEGFISERLFTNGLELTTTGHQLLADHAVGVIEAPVLVSNMPYTAIASGREIAQVGTRQVTPERIARRGWAPFVSGGIGQSTWDNQSGSNSDGVSRISGVAGVTYSLGSGIAVGAAAGLQDASKSSGSAIEAEGTGIYGTVFAGADYGRLFGNVSASVGSIDYDRIARHTSIGAASFENGGSSEATVYGGSIEMGVRALTHENILAAGPIVSLDHWSADVDGYDEDGWSATAVNYDSLDASSTRGSVGLFIEAGDLNASEMPVAFRAKALYTREFNSDPINVSARAASSPNNTFSREGREAQADSMTLGAQLSYNFGPVIGSISYDARIGEANDHAGRIDISVPLGGRRTR